MSIQIRYTRTLPDGVYATFQPRPPRLVINAGWWRGAPAAERAHVLARLRKRLRVLLRQDARSLPSRCPRCAGPMYLDYDETPSCLTCGEQVFAPATPTAATAANLGSLPAPDPS